MYLYGFGLLLISWAFFYKFMNMPSWLATCFWMIFCVIPLLGRAIAPDIEWDIFRSFIKDLI